MTGRFERVIVAFDGSPRAQDALALAQRLRDPGAGALTLARVVAARPWPLYGHERRVPAADGEGVDAALQEARGQVPPGIRVDLRSVVAASPARGLTELAEAEGADLVVVGSSRRGDAGRISLERTAGRLLQGAPCAVAVAPADLRDVDPFRHVGIAFDGTPEADRALAAGYAIAAGSGAAVTLFLAHSIDGVGGESEALARKAVLRAHEQLEAAASAAPAGVNPRTVLLHGAPMRVIAEACDGIVDLLVTGSRGYGPVQRALLGSVSEALMSGARHPVLVLPRG